MRSWIRGALLSLFLCTPALAQAPAAGTPSFGLSLDVGVPDGAVVSGVFHPSDWLRLSVGGGYNAIAPGVRVGATFTPWQLAVNPSLTIEAGHYFTGQPGSKLNTLVGSSGTAAQDFQHVSYDYGNLHLGLEFGGAKVAGFFHVGASYVHAVVHDFQSALQKNANDPSLTASDPTLRFTAPSLKLGMIFYFG